MLRLFVEFSVSKLSGESRWRISVFADDSFPSQHSASNPRKEDLGHRAACAKAAQAGLSATTAGRLFLQVKGVGVGDRKMARCNMRCRAVLEAASPSGTLRTL
jgi:hypothetical protein